MNPIWRKKRHQIFKKQGAWYLSGRFGTDGKMASSSSYQLSDEQWAKSKDFVPTNGQRGGQGKDHRLMVDAFNYLGMVNLAITFRLL
jgi:hypothetical protein